MTTANFNASNSTFRQLMGNGLTYHVPRFQRDYSWAGEEWNDLWQDIMALADDPDEPPNYMGYLVLQSDDERRFDIIDGQQRITTLSLLVLAAISHLQGLSCEPDDGSALRAEQLRSSYIGFLDLVSLSAESKLHLNRNNDRFYQEYMVPLKSTTMHGLNASERLLLKSLKFFAEQIKQYAADDGERVAKLMDDIADRLLFTVIKVTDELNAFKVFETLNARGVRLSTTDLLKNYLFSIASESRSHQKDLDTMEHQWESIVGTLAGLRFPDFLRTYWNSRHKLARKAGLFKVIKKSVADRGNAFALIHDLREQAGIYRALRNPADELWHADRQSGAEIRTLDMFGVVQPLPLLLAAFIKFHESDRDGFRSIVRAIGILSFRYNIICGRAHSEQERLYNTVAMQITDGQMTTSHDAIQALRPLYPDDDIFRNAFAAKTLRTTTRRNKNIAQYILLKLHEHLTGNPMDPHSDAVSLEHIMPENPGDGWQRIGDFDHEASLYMLGNMTLLETPINRELGNAEYHDKRPRYEQSAIAMTKAIATEYAEWNPDKIASRQQWMAKQATAIWRISQFDSRGA